MEILFLLPALNHVRFYKRIEHLKKYDNDSNYNILGFRRKSYPNDLEQDFNITELGIVKNKNYFKRVIPFLKSFKIIRKHLKEHKIIYCFSLDLLLMSLIAGLGIKDLKFVYEIGDVRSIFIGNNIKNKIARYLQRLALNRTSLLVVTSNEYVKGYMKKVQNINFDDNKYLNIENKIDKSNHMINKSKNRKNNFSGEIKIGWFGVLRCSRSLKILNELSKQNDKFKIYLRGIFSNMPNNDKIINQNDNIIYEGPYNNPEDLSAIYNEVDIVWAAYPYQEEEYSNWRWARTNRFYESMFFNKPVITQDKSADSKIVRDNNLGIIINMNDQVNTINKINNLSKNDLILYTQNVKDYPENNYVFTNEHSILLDKLKEIIN